jgi:hypothetical protein
VSDPRTVARNCLNHVTKTEYTDHGCVRERGGADFDTTVPRADPQLVTAFPRCIRLAEVADGSVVDAKEHRKTSWTVLKVPSGADQSQIEIANTWTDIVELDDFLFAVVIRIGPHRAMIPSTTIGGWMSDNKSCPL